MWEKIKDFVVGNPCVPGLAVAGMLVFIGLMKGKGTVLYMAGAGFLGFWLGVSYKNWRGV